MVFMTEGNMLTEQDYKIIIECISKGLPIPEGYRDLMFPTSHKEYELDYIGKIRKEDLLANEDGVTPVPIQVEKVFNGTEYPEYSSGWKNLIVFGDNLQFLKTIYENKDPLIKDKIKGKVKLIYIDPPFATSDEFQNKDGAKAYSDKKKGTEFIEFIRRRLIYAKEILSDDGAIFMHLDQKMSHYIKVIMDEVFGKNNFVNEIVWHFRTYQGQTQDYFPRKHNVIFWYNKQQRPKFNLSYDNNYEDTVDAERWKKYIVNGCEIRGTKYPKSDSRFMAYYDRWVKEHGRKPGSSDVILKISGYVIDDVWTDIQAIDPKDKTEKLGYPTQKPEQLLKRIIESVTEEGDIVFDFFGGSGTTISVAEKMNRRWITCDVGKLSYFTMQKRILRISKSKSLQGRGFYDRNAHSFMTSSLGLYDLPTTLSLEWSRYVSFVSSLFTFDLKETIVGGFKFDGIKNGHQVKIYDYKKFKDASVDEKYIRDIHSIVSKKISNRVYIVAPANNVDFISDYLEIGDIRYYFLKIPYHVIKELDQKPFQKFRQPRSSGDVNTLDEAIGFHFVRKPEVDSELVRKNDHYTLKVRKFQSKELESSKNDNEKSQEGFDLLSAVFIDEDYNDKAFEMDQAIFYDQLQISEDGISINLGKNLKGSKLMIVYTDIFGNDFTEVIDVSEVSNGR